MRQLDRRSSDGAAAVELAIILPLLVLLLFGMIVFGIQLFRAQSMQAAAREGGRLAAVGATVTEVIDRAFAEQHVAQTLGDLSVTLVREGATVSSGEACRDGDRGDLIEVTAAVADPSLYELSIPFFGIVGPDFSSVAVFRCE
jgi:Flp pilus assembly protein TadG